MVWIQCFHIFYSFLQKWKEAWLTLSIDTLSSNSLSELYGIIAPHILHFTSYLTCLAQCWTPDKTLNTVNTSLRSLINLSRLLRSFHHHKPQHNSDFVNYTTSSYNYLALNQKIAAVIFFKEILNNFLRWNCK